MEEGKNTLENNQQQKEDKPTLEENEHQRTVDSENIDIGYKLRGSKRLKNRLTELN